MDWSINLKVNFGLGSVAQALENHSSCLTFLPIQFQDHVLFFDWIKFWALYTIRLSQNRVVIGQSTRNEFSFFKYLLRQSLYDYHQIGRTSTSTF